MINEEIYSVHEVANIQLDSGIIPKPFNVEEYLSHFKRRHKRQSNSQPGNKRYVLFILDGSGSIGKDNFEKMKHFTANLSYVFQFCGHTALIVFNSCAYLQYDFDDHQTLHDNNDIVSELKKLKESIDNIAYPGGSTASGNAIEQAYNKVIQKILPEAKEIDIIFLTDGHSNTGRNVCEAAKEFWTLIYEGGTVKLHVFPIGIGPHIDYHQLYCIMGDDPELDDLHPLHILTFDLLNNITKNIQLDMENGPSNLDSEFCGRFGGGYQEMICKYVLPT